MLNTLPSSVKQALVRLVSLYIVAIGPDGAPNGLVYAQMMKDCKTIDVHNAVVDILTQSDVCTLSNHFLRLTPKGKELHTKLAQEITNQIAKLTVATQPPHG